MAIKTKKTEPQSTGVRLGITDDGEHSWTPREPEVLRIDIGQPLPSQEFDDSVEGTAPQMLLYVLSTLFERLEGVRKFPIEQDALAWIGRAIAETQEIVGQPPAGTPDHALDYAYHGFETAIFGAHAVPLPPRDRNDG